MQLLGLPVEVFQQIASYLSQKDKAECQFVCSLWYKKWIQLNYYRIHIRGKQQFQAFFYDTLQSSLFEPPYSTGYQIRKLIIDNGHIEPSVLGQLPLLCPFLEVLMFDGVILSQMARRESFQYYQQRRNSEELDKVRHCFALWKNMRELVELNGITVSYSLMQQVNNLTSVSVQFNNQNDRTNSKASFINSLHCAPKLQHLSIERIYISVKELETIHYSCPSLKSLQLMDTIMLPMKEEQLLIKPAIHLAQFRLVNGSFCDDVPHWLSYIAQKYNNANTLELGSCSFFSDTDQQQPQDINDTSHEIQLLSIARGCTKLKSLKIQPFCLKKPFFQILDQSGVSLNRLTLGDGLTASNLSQELYSLVRSQQRHYISNLSVLGWPLAVETRGLHTLMNSLKQCSRITTLNLSLGRQFYKNDTAVASESHSIATVYLDVILSACPSLLELTLRDAKVARSSYNLDSSPCYSLQSLKLENMLIDSGSDVFQLVANNCKDLVDLTLISTVTSPVYHNTRNFNIFLPRHCLRTLALDRVRVSTKCSTRLGVSRFKIIKDGNVMWYDLVGYECCTSRSFSNSRQMMISSTDKMRARKAKASKDADIPYSTLDESTYVSVMCKSVRSLYLTGLEIIEQEQ